MKALRIAQRAARLARLPSVSAARAAQSVPVRYKSEFHDSAMGIVESVTGDSVIVQCEHCKH
jgi:hypothetical protein